MAMVMLKTSEKSLFKLILFDFVLMAHKSHIRDFWQTILGWWRSRDRNPRVLLVEFDVILISQKFSLICFAYFAARYFALFQ